MTIQRLKVVYDGPGDGPEIDAELDKALEKTLAEFGYKMWASGCDLVPPFERDLAFEREIPEIDSTMNVKTDGIDSYRGIDWGTGNALSAQSQESP